MLEPAGEELLVSGVKSWGILWVSLDLHFCCLAYRDNKSYNTEMGLSQISELYMGMQRFPCKEGGVGKHPLLPSVDQDNAEHYVPCECPHVEVTRGRARPGFPLLPLCKGRPLNLPDSVSLPGN